MWTNVKSNWTKVHRAASSSVDGPYLIRYPAKEGGAGAAVLVIPKTDRPFIRPGERYSVYVDGDRLAFVKDNDGGYKVSDQSGSSRLTIPTKFADSVPFPGRTKVTLEVEGDFNVLNLGKIGSRG